MILNLVFKFLMEMFQDACYGVGTMHPCIFSEKNIKKIYSMEYWKHILNHTTSNKIS
jgi:hypothetical protein